MDTFLTIEAQSEGLFKDRGSKFIGRAFPVKSEDDVKEVLELLRKEYYDARHHCYAYILGRDGENFRANDDGEPNNSAGNPILGQLRSNELRNVLIVVVRYFGGTKLGVSGLINAYKTAAAEAILNNTIIEEIVEIELQLKFEYLSMNDVMKICKDYELEMYDQEFNLDCKMKIKIREKLLEEVLSKLEEISSLELTKL